NSTSTGATTTPSILDTLDVPVHNLVGGTSLSFTYTVPSSGTNKLLFVMYASGGAASTTATQNGASLSSRDAYTSGTRVGKGGYCFLANPTTGTFTLSEGNTTSAVFSVVTLQNATLTDPIDGAGSHTQVGPTSGSVTFSTTVGNDLLMDYMVNGG